MVHPLERMEGYLPSDLSAGQRRPTPCGRRGGCLLWPGSKKSLAAGDRLAGFRIGPGGDVELLTYAEVNAMINRVIREACKTLLVKRRFH